MTEPTEHGVYADTEAEAKQRCDRVCKSHDKRCTKVERRGIGTNAYWVCTCS